MGGAPALPRVVEFRGIWTDATTVELLVELARISGPIYVDPIGGCGSWQGWRVLTPDGQIITLGSTANSAETHTGDGVVDLNCEHLTDDEARRLETLCRMLGCAAWFRPAVSPYTGNAYGWQRHIHLIRQDAANLPDAARRQVTAYRNKLDGLAVPHADRGSHAYLTRTWADYLREKEDTVTPEQLQQILAAINSLPAKVWNQPLTGHDEDGAGPKEAPEAPARSWLVMGRRDAGRAYWNTDSVEAQLAAVRLALADDDQLDPAQLATQLAQLLGPQLHDALVAELPKLDVDVDAIASGVLSRLGAALVDEPVDAA
jgi:hypothetical protein